MRSGSLDAGEQQVAKGGPNAEDLERAANAVKKV